jgi:molybdopterin converting factor subunit 1
MGTLNVNVLYFAHVRAKVGLSHEVIGLETGATAADALSAIVLRHPALSALLPVIRLAVDGEFVTGDHPLHDGAELVLIPPVAGGAGVPRVALVETPLEGVMATLEGEVSGPDRGAIVTFQGRVRDHARGQTVTGLEYEAYPRMALTQMQRIVAEVEAQFPGTSCALHHRVGVLQIGEIAVIAVVSHAHRGPAFEACQRLIERLKQDVPIWKHETGPDGSTWVTDRP